MLSDEQVFDVTQETWVTVLGTQITPTEGPVVTDLDAMVSIAGPSGTAISLAVPQAVANAAAAIMLGCSSAELQQEDVLDAVGELANIIAGGIKRLLPGNHKLGLPEVSDHAEQPGEDVHVVRFQHDGERFEIRLRKTTEP